MRALTGGISGQLSVSGALAGWLLEITITTGQVLRYTSLDIGSTYAGFAWQPLDIALPQISWDGTVLKPGTLVLGDADVTFWALGLDLLLADAGIRLWAIYAAAPTEAEPVYTGRIGQVTRDGKALTVSIALTNGSDTVSSPRRRVQYLLPPVFLLPGGSILTMGGQTVTITRPGAPAR